MNTSTDKEVSDPLLFEKRLTRFVLTAGLFWNNDRIIHSFVQPDGIFYWHGSTSDGEKFCGFLETIGVLLHDGRRGYRLAIRQDAIELYADYLVEKGLQIEAVIDAIFCVGAESWLETSLKPFPAKFYDNDDGTTSFDCRQLMLDLVSLGYAEKDKDLYNWTSKMEPIVKANYY